MPRKVKRVIPRVKYRDKAVRVTITVPGAILGKVDQEASRQGITRSNAISQILADRYQFAFDKWRAD